MTRCARCEWCPDPDAEARPSEQLADHARDAGHWLCPSCAHSLTDVDPLHGCEACLTDARALLSGITTMYLELPEHLGHLNGSLRPQAGRSSDGKPLPGGDALVLLSGGSEGYSDDGVTAKDGDPPSVSFELGWWAMDLMDSREDPEELGERPRRIVVKAAGYLERHARWMANNHPGFAQMHGDLKALHARLERATGRGEVVVKANASCFDCGGDLIHDTVTISRHAGQGEDGPLRMGPVPTEEGSHTCRRCRRRYTPAELNLAQRAAWETVEDWVPLVAAARAAGLNVETVEKWAKRNVVATCCPVEGGRKMVWWPDVRARTRRAS